MVHFVGAGPGAADLLTVRGAKLIREADVIVYAGSLVSRELLSEAKEGCRIYDSARMTLEEIVGVMCQAVRSGQTVVRLHTGEPSLYGAVREQMDVLDAEGISYDSTPGVTAAFGAAASLNLEYTIPDISQTLIITRMEGRTPVPERERIAKLAGHQASMAIYLSAGQAKRLRSELLAGGYEADTPVAVVYRATWQDEKVIYSNVNEFSDRMQEQGIDRHAVILVGKAIRKASSHRSKLYDAAFSTGFRPARSGGKTDSCSGLLNLNIISFTDEGDRCGRKIAGQLAGANMDAALYPVADRRDGMKIRDVVKSSFDDQIPILFIGAMGICVRLIAPFVKDKLEDIPVLVMDEKAEHIIPVLSGHVGGANRLAERIAAWTGAEAVLTTATDVQGVFAVDVWAAEQGLSICNRDGIRKVSAKLLAGETATMAVQDDRYEIGENGLPEGIALVPWGREADIRVAEIANGWHDALLRLCPRHFVLGIGCKRGVSEERLQEFTQRVAEREGIPWKEIAAVATIDRKADEEGLAAFCRRNRLPLVTYSAKQLAAVHGAFAGSSFVRKTVGVDNVCERAAAAYASDMSDKWSLRVAKTAGDGMTAAVCAYEWKVSFP